jgi:primosomal protein N' (replication factor Y)
MAQVSGRAGRKNKRGMVIIQALNPNHPIIKQVMENDYKGMYNDQVKERKNFSYPPFVRLIEFTIRNKNMEDMSVAASNLAVELVKKFEKKRVLGPEYPLIARVQNYFQKTILLKIEKEKYSPAVKHIISEIIHSFYAKGKESYRTRIKVDVDPV